VRVTLPGPDSDELADILGGKRVARSIYRVLFDHRDSYLTIGEIRGLIDIDGGAQQHLDRRLRDLDYFFEIERGPSSTYRLLAPRPGLPVVARPISKRVRAYILRDQRCAQCGRTPSHDHVRLHVDHRIPQSWGGTSDQENLQALCSECNEGKRDYYASISEDVGAAILAAAAFDEPQKRIGEALIAAYPGALRSDLLERIASAKQYQEDWQRRLRDLRFLDWQIAVHKEKVNGRTMASYALVSSQPWPNGPIMDEVKRRAAERKRGRASGSG
jgi:hypothetical protein